MRILARLFAILVLAPVLSPASAPATTPGRAAAIDRVVEAELGKAKANGLAVAIVEHGQVVRVRCYGTRNVRGDPLTPQSIMYGASLTKAVFAYTVMRLADEGKVAQDEPIAAMLSKPLPDYGNLDKYGNWGDLAGDSRWRKLTPRILLSHAGGFANFSFLEPDQKLRFHFEPGGRYAYSGEGLILLQFAIEQRLGHGFEEDAQRLAFRPLGMTDSSLHWQDRFAGRLADGWQVDGTAILHDRRDNVRVAGSMDTTIADMAKFASALVTGVGLSQASHQAMLAPQLPITTATQFPTLQSEVPQARRVAGLAAGLGVVVFDGPQGRGFYKGGHDDQTGNVMVCLRQGQRCVVLLGNDVRAERAFPAIVKAVLGDTGVPWQWEYGIQQP